MTEEIVIEFLIFFALLFVAAIVYELGRFAAEVIRERKIMKLRKRINSKYCVVQFADLEHIESEIRRAAHHIKERNYGNVESSIESMKAIITEILKNCEEVGK